MKSFYQINENEITKGVGLFDKEDRKDVSARAGYKYSPYGQTLHNREALDVMDDPDFKSTKQTNKKIKDIENGLITVIMDETTYSETKEKERSDYIKSGFSQSLYQFQRFLKEIEKVDEITFENFKTFLDDIHHNNIYWFNDVVTELNRIFRKSLKKEV